MLILGYGAIGRQIAPVCQALGMQVSGVRRLETELFQTASVQAAVDFNNLRAVLVVTNFSPTDVTPLLPEQTTP